MKERKNMKNQITSKLAAALRKAAVISLTLLLGVVYPAAQAGVCAQTPSKATASSHGGGQKEGIKVHGHWTIDVRNPDGTLVKHIDFENGLTLDGAGLIEGILGRQKTPGAWAIRLWGSAWPASGATGVAQIYEVGTSVPISPDIGFATLTLSLPVSQGYVNAIVLKGTAVAKFSGSVTSVETLLGYCSPDVPPNTCRSQAGGVNDLTYAYLATPVNGSCPPNTQCAVSVAGGQIIQVTVVISFS
jgi:hypothetical protein